ncbi:MAG: NAD-dependent malic enzyme, partial [Candidatus Electrothrix sp. ATG1]|nr:NAD-dependent malic enzyme [Candidatus Electrothrix sp. ATG1]
EVALCAEGVSEEEARQRIFTLDSRGLITSDSELLPYKEKFAQDPAGLDWLQEEKDRQLENVVKKAGITVLIGTSGQPGCFSKEVVSSLLEHTDRPVVMPLSNPTDYAEAAPEDIYMWTRGRALIGTGSPFPDVMFEGQAFSVAQANNVFIFPGVGLGALVSGSRAVLPEFFTAAAEAVSSCVSAEAMRDGALLPPVTDLAEVSIKVAQAVGEAAIAAGVSRHCAFSSFQHQNDPVRLQQLIRNFRWQPTYLPLVAM